MYFLSGEVSNVHFYQPTVCALEKIFSALRSKRKNSPVSSFRNWLYAFTFLHFILIHFGITLMYLSCEVWIQFYFFFSAGYPVCLYHNRINLSHAVLGLALYYSWYVCRYVCLSVYQYVCICVCMCEGFLVYSISLHVEYKNKHF